MAECQSSSTSSTEVQVPSEVPDRHCASYTSAALSDEATLRLGSAGRKRNHKSSEPRSEQSSRHNEAMVLGNVTASNSLLCTGTENPQIHTIGTMSQGVMEYGGPVAKHPAVRALLQEPKINNSSSPTNSPGGSPSGSPGSSPKNDSKPSSRDSVRTQSPREETRMVR